MRETTIQQTIDCRIIAIIRGVEEERIPPLAEALYAGGIRMLEVTFDLSAPDTLRDTGRKISVLRERMEGKICPGAGTVTTPEQVETAAKAGALYIISPNTDVKVIERTRELGLVSMPGATTPSEAVAAHAAGADFVKLFPAGVLGSAYLKSISSPLNHIRFLAVGGIGMDNAAEFIGAGAVGLGIGGRLVDPQWVQTGAYSKVTAFAECLVRTIAGRVE